MLIKRTKERSPEITPDNRGVIWGKELNGMATDEELYGQYLSGDETGLELLIKKYGDPLTLYIDGYLHDVHEAEDLMMETFSWLFTKKPRIRDGCFKAYLYKAARHKALRHKSRRRIIFSLDDLTREPEAQTLVEEVIRTKERNQILHLCMASPLLIAALCMGKRQRKFFLFCFAGMGACLLSAYINTFFAALYRADTFAATTEIAPVVEEVMKLLPLLFYLLIFEPKAERIKNAAVITALSFATFENVCYLIQNGAGHFSFIFFRGIGTGAMHVICGAIVGSGLAYVWQRTWLKIAGTCGLLGAAITFHAIYNLLIAYGGAAQYIAYLLPVLILAAGKLIFRSSIQ